MALRHDMSTDSLAPATSNTIAAATTSDAMTEARTSPDADHSTNTAPPALSLQEAEQLLAQTQRAHRLAAGFYERLLLQIKTLAQCCDARFDSWGPKYMERSKRGRNPASHWPWELLPLFSSWHLYLRSDTPQAQPGDLHLLVRVYLEDSFQPDPQQGSSRRRPDPLQMPAGKALVEVELYACKQAATQGLAKLVLQSKQQSKLATRKPVHDQGWIDIHPQLNFWGTTLPMAHFVSDFASTRQALELALQQLDQGPFQPAT